MSFRVMRCHFVLKMDEPPANKIDRVSPRHLSSSVIFRHLMVPPLDEIPRKGDLNTTREGARAVKRSHRRFGFFLTSHLDVSERSRVVVGIDNESAPKDFPKGVE
jgi:hypothetical protein